MTLRLPKDRIDIYFYKQLIRVHNTYNLSLS